MNEKELIQLQLRQLKRLLDTKRLTFRDAFYVIFSDYPSYGFLNTLLNNDYYSEVGLQLESRFYKEMDKLK
jgi:hypothetical protein